MANSELIESIRRVEQDIRESKARIKQLGEAKGDEIKQLSEHSRLLEAVSELKIAQELLKRAMRDEKDIINIDADMTEERAKL
jgi:hypothetical protein